MEQFENRDFTSELIEDSSEDYEGFEPGVIDDSTTTTAPTSKWIGCANHTFQLALKVLDKDEVFASKCSLIIGILRSFARSSIAVQDLRNLTNRSIVLPNITR